MWSGLRLVALALLVALPSSCRRDSSPSSITCPSASAAPAVDPALLGFLSAARSAHHQADLREQDSNLSAATRALEGLVAGAKPAGKHPEVDEVLSDTHARLADLYSRQGQTSQALRAVEQGLELAPDPTYFRGHLFEVRGIIEERDAEALTKVGKAEEAKRAKERALSAFEEAMRIQQRVIEGAASGRP